MPITLQKFGPQWNIADSSPFCIKLESFLRLNSIPYEARDFDPKKTFTKSPKRKVPFVTFTNGEIMGDSTLIIKRLCRENSIDMDKGLNIEQKAVSNAFRIMLDEGFYWPALYSRWVDDRGWKIIQPIFFGSAPPVIGDLIAAHLRKGIRQSIYAQGMGRHTEAELYAIGTDMLKSLSDHLGHNQWFFGQNQPGLLDIWAHAFIISIIRPPIETVLKKNTLEFKNLCRHAENFEKLVYNGAASTAKTRTPPMRQAAE